MTGRPPTWDRGHAGAVIGARTPADRWVATGPRRHRAGGDGARPRSVAAATTQGRTAQTPSATARLGLQVVQVGPGHLPGDLFCADGALGLVIFAHGSGSSRLSPRNRQVADVMHDYRLDTLLFDLLTPEEAAQRDKVFDIALLCERLCEAIAWAREAVGHHAVGLFGASTGAAAALCAAAREPASVAAVVSRGGRPDLAGDALSRVLAPTLLIVGGLDTDVLQLNRAALGRLAGARRLEVVPGATHLFAEAGALATVAHLAGSWFETHLRAGGRA